MKRRISIGPFVSIVLLAVAIVFSAAFYFLQNKDLGQADPSRPRQSEADREISTVSINDVLIEVELAQTPDEKIQGLSGRNSLSANTGMLFVYDQPDFYLFWMKDMQFPIDILWIDKNYKIIDITKNLQPESFPQTFAPSAPVQYVLEVNAGFADINGVRIKDDLDFKL